MMAQTLLRHGLAEQLEPLDDGWYYTYVPRFVQNIIVNASEASVQTEGIAVEAGKADLDQRLPMKRDRFCKL